MKDTAFILDFNLLKEQGLSIDEYLVLIHLKDDIIYNDSESVLSSLQEKQFIKTLTKEKVILREKGKIFLELISIENIDSLGNKLLDWKWDPFINGDYAHQYFEIWSLNNIGSNGIAIGTHNGMTGEWVGPINKGILKGTLVEASDNQYNDLFRFYNGKTWVTCLQSLITTNGDDVLFYEGGNGFTNSLSNKIIEQYVNIDLINSSIKKSKSINDLIIESSERGRVKWLHIDVEGLDGELIYAIKDDLLPELLLFESLHMENEYYDNLCNYLINKGYSITKSGWNTICLK